MGRYPPPVSFTLDCIELALAADKRTPNAKEDVEFRLSFRPPPPKALAAFFRIRSAAYYLVSMKLAARQNVDMERAKSDLEEHPLVCVSGAKLFISDPCALGMRRLGALPHRL